MRFFICFFMDVICVTKTLKLTQLKIKEITKFIKATAIENDKSKRILLSKIILYESYIFASFFLVF